MILHALVDVDNVNATRVPEIEFIPTQSMIDDEIVGKCHSDKRRKYPIQNILKLFKQF